MQAAGLPTDVYLRRTGSEQGFDVHTFVFVANLVGVLAKFHRVSYPCRLTPMVVLCPAGDLAVHALLVYVDGVFTVDAWNFHGAKGTATKRPPVGGRSWGSGGLGWSVWPVVGRTVFRSVVAPLVVVAVVVAVVVYVFHSDLVVQINLGLTFVAFVARTFGATPAVVYGDTVDKLADQSAVWASRTELGGLTTVDARRTCHGGHTATSSGTIIAMRFAN